MTQQSLITTVVGSYPQPDWLVDRALLSKGVPRVRLRGIWRVPEDLLEQAQDDATIVAIRDMERAGIDIISDGRSGARATRTGSPPRWTGWMWTSPR
jgi:5-methyltetrahydropteroyltriglutamate--homocysteine methyltransferase